MSSSSTSSPNTAPLPSVATPAATASPSNVSAPASGSATAAAPAQAPFSTASLLAAMLRNAPKVSDLFFTPGKPPMTEVNGRLSAFGARALTLDDTRHIASELIGDNKHALGNLREQGSCDVSYSLPGASRFRVNVFMQRGSCAIVMRVIPSKVPNFAELNLPAELQHVANLRTGIVPGTIEFETGMGYATNAGNLRLELADFAPRRSSRNRQAQVNFKRPLT